MFTVILLASARKRILASPNHLSSGLQCNVETGMLRGWALRTIRVVSVNRTLMKVSGGNRGLAHHDRASWGVVAASARCKTLI